MVKKIEAQNHPSEAFTFRLPEADVQFEEGAGPDGGARFSIAALSGKPIRHWYWGNFAIQLDGIKGKSTIPVLLDHDVSQRIGVSKSREIDSKRGLVMNGHFLKSSKLADQVRSESKDGFPWEASVRVNALAIERIDAGVETIVNGVSLKGPGHVFRQSELREVSFTALGADSNTSAEALSASPGLDADSSTATLNGDNMVKKIETEETGTGTGSANAAATVTLSADEVRKQAVEAERARVAAIREAATPEQAQLVESLVVGGEEASVAQKKLADDLRLRFRQLAQQLKIGDKPLSGGNGTGIGLSGGSDPRATKLAEVNAMPLSLEKFDGLWELDAKLADGTGTVREVYLSKDHYLADQETKLAVWKPEFMRRFGEARKARPKAADQWADVALAASSPSTPVTIAGVRAGYAMQLQAQLGASWSRIVASAFDSSSPSETYPWLRMAPQLRKWEGERSVQELATDQVTLFNDDYESTIEFRVADLRRDKTAQMMARAADLATRVAFFPESLLTQLITANGNAYDGVAFFGSTHVVGSSGTIDNDMTTADGGLAGGAAPSTAQQSANLLAMVSRMLGFLDDQGQPLNEAARQFIVMVPATLFGVTVAAINAMFTSASATNPLGELARFGFQMVPLLNARLPASPGNVQYLFRTDAGIRSFLLQEEGVNPVELGPDSEHAKKTNRVLFGHGWAGAVGYGRFELAVRGTNA